MTKSIRILFLSLLAALCLGFTSCSDKDEEPGGGTAKDYEYNDYYTALLRQAWKITEHEYADKSYYTKDFKTSWVINEPFNYEGTEYCPFNYKLSLQSEINYVESVEVGTFADGEDWIVDLGTGRRLFAIESLTYGGNRYIMILRDTAGNRFRCHSVDGPCILFVENVTDRALAAQYVRTFEYTDNGNSTATVDELGYTIKSLPANTIGAYAVLLTGSDYGVDIKFTASNGNSKLLTCTNLRSGWNRGVISGDFGSSDEPETPVTPGTGNTPTAEDVAKLEAKLWQDGCATAWRIDSGVENIYNWLITERNIGLQQGLHLGGGYFALEIDANYLLKIEKDKLYLAPWDNNGENIEILTPINEILNKGYMDIRFASRENIYRCVNSQKPLIVYADCQRNISDICHVIQYDIQETTTYGQTLPLRTITGSFGYTVSNVNPIAAWCLIADEVLSPYGSTFSIVMHTSDVNGFDVYTYKGLRLGQTYNCKITR